VIRVQPFCLEDDTLVAREPERFGITKIHRDDKTAGRRLGFRFETREGMSQVEADRFAAHALRTVLRAHRMRRNRPERLP
jgi:hypothetical protein